MKNSINKTCQQTLWKCPVIGVNNGGDGGCLSFLLLLHKLMQSQRLAGLTGSSAQADTKMWVGVCSSPQGLGEESTSKIIWAVGRIQFLQRLLAVGWTALWSLPAPPTPFFGTGSSIIDSFQCFRWLWLPPLPATEQCLPLKGSRDWGRLSRAHQLPQSRFISNNLIPSAKSH